MNSALLAALFLSEVAASPKDQSQRHAWSPFILEESGALMRLASLERTVLTFQDAFVVLT